MNKRARIAVLGLIVLLIFLLAGVAWAGSSDNYVLDWWVMSGGGAPASGSGGVTLNGSLGQTAIGPSAGGGVGLDAGYWAGVGPKPPILSTDQFIFLPIVVRDR